MLPEVQGRLKAMMFGAVWVVVPFRIILNSKSFPLWGSTSRGTPPDVESMESLDI